MRKNGKIISVILMVVFAVLLVVMLAATSRAFVYGLFGETMVHLVFMLVFLTLFIVFGRNALKDKGSPKAIKIGIWVYVLVFLALMICLLGFAEYIAAIAVGIAYVAVPFIIVFSGKGAKKTITALALLVVVLFGVTVPGYFYRVFEREVRERTAELYISEENGYFASGVAPEKIYVYTPVPTTNSEVLLHNSLQAFVSARYSDQIIYESDRTTSAEYTAMHIETIQKYFPYVEIERVDSQEELLEIYNGRVKKYILFDDGDRDSMFVAANLCNQMEAVMVGKSIVNVAERHGWEQVFDATGWTEEEFAESKYFEKLDRHIMIMIDSFSEKTSEAVPEIYMSEFWDLGILNNAWIVHNEFSLVELENHLKKLNRNSICIGSLAENAENAVVQACARYSTTFIYTRYTANMSVLSGFDLKNATVNSDVLNNGEINKVEPTVYSDDATPKHTVCVMLSDADNVRFCTESLMNDHYYQSPLRDENLQYNIGLAGSMVEIAPIFLLEFYDWMQPSNDFCYQLSSIGYTYPSKWTDEEAWEQVTKTMVKIMGESKTNVLEIMDDSALFGVIDLPCSFGRLEKYFDTYTKYDEVDGCLFIDYTQLYSGYRGAICWSNDKPVVSAKYSVWYDEGTPYNSARNTIDGIVKEVNEMPTDKTSEDSYTFIIVHGWSGLDENGNLVYLNLASKDIDNTAIFKALSDGFDEDVEMVSTTEFISRMRRNVKR